jgi:undecaprenyl-phosphate 4-deoxy-4-formamido-L-arabinose transferase
MSQKPEISVVIPVYNEQDNIPHLISRLMPALDALNRSYEVVITNDGSRDKSWELLEEAYESHLGKIQLINFHANYGQHMAIIAAFEVARGQTIITLDADLQNPPEEISKLMVQIDAGFDYVGGYRDERRGDPIYRGVFSRLMNYVREKITDIKMRDQGCMFRAYSREVIDQIIESRERSTFIPALAYKFSKNPTEVELKHEQRAAGISKYNMYKLIRLNFDLITSFSLVPLQMFTLFGMGVSCLSGILVIYMLLRRVFVGPEVEGVFTLFAILFFLVSVVIVGIGLVGEYIGRIFMSLSNRPRFIIQEHKNTQKMKAI